MVGRCSFSPWYPEAIMNATRSFFESSGSWEAMGHEVTAVWNHLITLLSQDLAVDLLPLELAKSHLIRTPIFNRGNSRRKTGNFFNHGMRLTRRNPLASKEAHIPERCHSQGHPLYSHQDVSWNHQSWQEGQSMAHHGNKTGSLHPWDRWRPVLPDVPPQCASPYPLHPGSHHDVGPWSPSSLVSMGCRSRSEAS